MSEMLKSAESLKETMIKHRRTIHQNPELGSILPVTAAYVIHALREMGYDPEEICPSSVVALAVGKKPGKTLLLRADMDGLPMTEDTDLPFKSENHCMHACGHDLHTAMLLGAAQLIKQREEEIQGTVKFMFQPGEETLTGAFQMIGAGVLENPRVDAAVSLHVMAGMGPAQTGNILYNSGPIASSVDSFRITISGRGGHGAMPHYAVDPINVGAHLHLALQEIISREVDPGQAVVLTVGKFVAGDAPNIIPDTAVLEGTIRTFNQSVREYVVGRMKEVAESTAKTFKASARVEIIYSGPALINDERVTDEIIGYIKEIAGESKVHRMTDKMMGSEDFAYVLEKVPGCYFSIGAGSPEEGFPYFIHHPKALFNEEVLPVGAAALAHAALEWLKHNG